MKEIFDFIDSTHINTLDALQLKCMIEDVRSKAIDEVFDYLKTQRDKRYMKVNLDDLEIKKYKKKLKADGRVRE